MTGDLGEGADVAVVVAQTLRGYAHDPERDDVRRLAVRMGLWLRPREDVTPELRGRVIVYDYKSPNALHQVARGVAEFQLRAAGAVTSDASIDCFAHQICVRDRVTAEIARPTSLVAVSAEESSPHPHRARPATR